MNLLQISLRNVRTRPVSSALTCLSVALGAALVASLWLMIDQTDKRYKAGMAGYDAIVGPKEGSPLTLVLSTVLNLGEGTGLVPMGVYDELRQGPLARRYGIEYAIPQARGDTFGGFPLVGTTDEMFTKFARGDDPDGNPRHVELADGRFWDFGHEPFVAFAKEQSERLRYFAENGEYPDSGEHDHAHDAGHDHDHAHGGQESMLPAAWRQAVIGATVAKSLDMRVGSKFTPIHGKDERVAHAHSEAETEVVGVLEPTGTPLDRVIWVPISLFLSLDGHEPLITPDTDLEQDMVQLTGIVVGTKAHLGGEWLRKTFQTRDDAQAAVPRQQIIRLLSMIGNAVEVLRVIAWLVIAVASIGVCVALYNTMNERRREIAIMRSLGARRAQIVTVILAEAAVIAVLGAVLGVILCHLGAFVAGDWIAERTGVGVDWATFAVRELWLILGVAVLGGLAGLLPAVKGSLTEVADNLGPVS